MNSLRTNRRSKQRAFTLTELMVASALVGVVGLTAFSVLTSTMKLSTENTVTNMSNYRARQTLDRLGETVRFAQDTPVLITTAGAVATGTTSDGILIKNSFGGPYIFRNTSGSVDADIPSGATAFQVQYSPSIGVDPYSSDPTKGLRGSDVPKVGDYFAINLATQPELEVATVGTPVLTTLADKSVIAKIQITTKTGLTEIAKPSAYTVSARRFRKDAYIFVQSGTSWTLRRYSPVTASTNYSNAASYTVLGQGFQKIGTQAWFTTVTDSGTQATWLRAVARTSNRKEYAERTGNALTTMPVQIKLWNYNAPPPPATP